MQTALKPTPAMGPYSVEMLGLSHFNLHRHVVDGEQPAGPETVDRLFIEPDEIPALRAALIQVAEHPHFVEGRWDTSRSWLTAEAPYGYTTEQIAAGNEEWDVTRGRAAVVIAGPIWNPLIWPNGAFMVQVEYARLDELMDALGPV